MQQQHTVTSLPQRCERLALQNSQLLLYIGIVACTVRDAASGHSVLYGARQYTPSCLLRRRRA